MASAQWHASSDGSSLLTSQPRGNKSQLRNLGLPAGSSQYLPGLENQASLRMAGGSSPS